MRTASVVGFSLAGILAVIAVVANAQMSGGAAALIASGIIVATVIAESLSSSSAQNSARYLPEYTAAGDLILPKNFHQWVYVGSPLTPNALNGGSAGFPEFHNVDIEPGSYEIYKQTNQFPEQTVAGQKQRPDQAGSHRAYAR